MYLSKSSSSYSHDTSRFGETVHTIIFCTLQGGSFGIGEAFVDLMWEVPVINRAKGQLQ